MVKILPFPSRLRHDSCMAPFAPNAVALPPIKAHFAKSATAAYRSHQLRLADKVITEWTIDKRFINIVEVIIYVVNGGVR